MPSGKRSTCFGEMEKVSAKSWRVAFSSLSLAPWFLPGNMNNSPGPHRSGWSHERSGVSKATRRCQARI